MFIIFDIFLRLIQVGKRAIELVVHRLLVIVIFDFLHIPLLLNFQFALVVVGIDFETVIFDVISRYKVQYSRDVMARNRVQTFAAIYF